MASMEEINARRTAGVGRAAESIGDVFRVGEGERRDQRADIMAARILQPEDREQYRRYAMEIAKMSGLPPTVNEDVVNRATYGGLSKIQDEWKTRFGEHSQNQRTRQAVQGREKPTDWGEVIAREEGAAKEMLEADAVSDGKRQPLSPVLIRMAAGSRLARTYPKQFPATAALYRQLEVARQQGGDIGAINHAKAILADPQKRAALEHDPYAMRALTSFIEAEPIVRGSPEVPGDSPLMKMLKFKEYEKETVPAVPGQRLPLN